MVDLSVFSGDEDEISFFLVSVGKLLLLVVEDGGGEHGGGDPAAGSELKLCSVSSALCHPWMPKGRDACWVPAGR